MAIKNLFTTLAQKPMRVALLMGFSSGLPLLLTSRTLQSWMSYTGGTNQAVAIIALVGLPYSLKFLWAPFMDRYTISNLGRRRGWIFATQLALFLSIAAISRLNPIEDFAWTAALALIISFFSASQDVVVDAYRRETILDEEQGLATSMYSLGYRIAMWIAGGLVLIMADHISWNTAYLLIAFVMLFSSISVFWADEPPPAQNLPHTLKDAVILPLKDFFGRPQAVTILMFILFYKLGDAMSGNMLAKFYAFHGFSAQEVGIAAKSTVPFSAPAGAFVGGVLILRVGLFRSLFTFGIVQIISTLGFIILNFTPHSIWTLGSVVFFEDFSAGMGSAALVAYMASLTNINFTATQFALMGSLAALPRTFISSVTGVMVDTLGWTAFFAVCGVMALPGLMLIRYLTDKNSSHVKSGA